jgi:hypothetical protein
MPQIIWAITFQKVIKLIRTIAKYIFIKFYYAYIFTIAKFK